MNEKEKEKLVFELYDASDDVNITYNSFRAGALAVLNKFKKDPEPKHTAQVQSVGNPMDYPTIAPKGFMYLIHFLNSKGAGCTAASTSINFEGCFKRNKIKKITYFGMVPESIISNSNIFNDEK